jgi:arabinofuranosyltransferase
MLKSNHEKRNWYIVLAGSFLMQFLSISFNSKNLIDDSYIYFRYADNIANGHGYVYNEDEKVEGATSVAWTLLLAFSSSMHISPECGARGLGFICLLGIVYIVWRMGYRSGMSLGTVMLVLVLILNQNCTYAVMRGLETGLYALLISWLVYILTGGDESYIFRKKSLIALSVGGVFLAWTRPESALVLLLIILTLRVFYPKRTKEIFILGILWGMGITIVTLWRLEHFGSFLPNSVIAKSSVGLMLSRWSVFQS